MRYTLTHVSGPAKRVFKADQVYDDRDIVRLAAREGFYVTRPNGNRRIRGSGRLLVMSGRDNIAKFERYKRTQEAVQKAAPIAMISGRLI